MKVNLDVGSCVDGNGAGERKGWEERESERVYIFGTPALKFPGERNTAPPPPPLLLSFDHSKLRILIEWSTVYLES